MSTLIIGVALAALALTACGPKGSVNDGSGLIGGGVPARSAPAPMVPDPHTSESPSPGTTPTTDPGGDNTNGTGEDNVPAPPKLNATYWVSRSGGIAGSLDSVTIKTDGSWTLTHNEEPTDSGKLSATQIKQLNTLAADKGLSVTPTYKPGESCPDQINYVLKIGGSTYRSVPCHGMPNDVFKQILGLVGDATGF